MKKIALMLAGLGMVAAPVSAQAAVRASSATVASAGIVQGVLLQGSGNPGPRGPGAGKGGSSTAKLVIIGLAVGLSGLAIAAIASGGKSRGGANRSPR